MYVYACISTIELTAASAVCVCVCVCYCCAWCSSLRVGVGLV